MSVFDKTDTDIHRIVQEKYDKNYLIDGQKGVANFTYKYIVMDKDGNSAYMVSDVSRGHGKYKISETEIVIDPEMKGLANKVYPIIKEKGVEIVQNANPIENKILCKGFYDINDMDNNNVPFRKHMVSLLMMPIENLLQLEQNIEYNF